MYCLFPECALFKLHSDYCCLSSDSATRSIAHVKPRMEGASKDSQWSVAGASRSTARCNNAWATFCRASALVVPAGNSNTSRASNGLRTRIGGPCGAGGAGGPDGSAMIAGRERAGGVLWTAGGGASRDTTGCGGAGRQLIAAAMPTNAAASATGQRRRSRFPALPAKPGVAARRCLAARDRRRNSLAVSSSSMVSSSSSGGYVLWPVNSRYLARRKLDGSMARPYTAKPTEI